VTVNFKVIASDIVIEVSPSVKASALHSTIGRALITFSSWDALAASPLNKFNFALFSASSFAKV